MTLQDMESKLKVLKDKASWFLMYDEDERWSRAQAEISDLKCLIAAEIESQAVVEDIERLASESEEDVEYLKMVEQSKALQEYLENESAVDLNFYDYQEEN